jgi:hypothetical protein
VNFHPDQPRDRELAVELLNERTKWQYHFEPGEVTMKSLIRVVIATALFIFAGTFPATAQIDTGMNFTTSFPFYAQNAKLPAGSYRISQADSDTNELLIESADGKYSAFVDFIPTRAAQPHKQSDVTFHKYGNVDYLNRIWVEGQRYGMKILPTKSEKKAAASAAMTEHAVVGKKH